MEYNFNRPKSFIGWLSFLNQKNPEIFEIYEKETELLNSCQHVGKELTSSEWMESWGKLKQWRENWHSEKIKFINNFKNKQDE